MYDLVRTIDATTEPVTLTQAESQCRLAPGVDSDVLNLYIAAARKMCEKRTNRAFIQQTWKLSLEAFPCFRAMNTPEMLSRFYGSGYGYLQGTGSGYWPGYTVPYIQLPRPKLIGIVSVTYLDANGQRQTLDPSLYQVDVDGEPASVSPAPGTTWPFALCRPGSVQITYTAGYGATADSVPETLKLAILMLVGHFYENREASVLPSSGTGVVEIPLGVAELLADETLTIFEYET